MTKEVYFQSPAVLKMNGIATKADGTIDATFNFQEMDPAYAASLHGMRGKFGQCAFVAQDVPLSSGQIEEFDVPDVPLEYKGQKSKSQVMRGKLYHLWTHMGSKGDFELFYVRSMDRFIDQVEEKMT